MVLNLVVAIEFKTLTVFKVLVCICQNKQLLLRIKHTENPQVKLCNLIKHIHQVATSATVNPSKLFVMLG